MIHELKVESKDFRQIIERTRTFEVRVNDRNYQIGDFLGLNEIPNKENVLEEKVKETGRCLLVKIIGLLNDPEYVREGYVIISFTPCEIAENVYQNVPYYENRQWLDDARVLYFRYKKVSYHFCWPSDDAFYFILGDGELTDSTGEAYCIQLRYYTSSDKWITEIWWDGSSKEIGFDGSDEYITEQEIAEIKAFISRQILRT